MLAGAAAQYLLLAAEFVAVTQVLVYVGAVMVLFLFGVMLTRAKLGLERRPQQQERDDRRAGGAAHARRHGVRADRRVRRRPSCPTTVRQAHIAAVSDSIFRPYLLPFWALSFVLLAAVIGAIVLARKD